MPERIVLHVGTHKTGTSSLQQFLRDENAGLLAAAGASYPPGLVLPTSHSELPLLAIRPERTWPARIRFPETQRATWLAAAEEHVRGQVLASHHDVVVYSHEDLSYVRFADELERLRDLLGELPVRVVVFLRDKAAFLRSYREQLDVMGFSPSEDRSSFAYVKTDSWLVDYDGLLAGYRRSFGKSNVEVLDYDETVRRDGSVIPVFADLLGLSRSSLPHLDGYFLNRAGMHVRPTEEQLAAIRRRLAQQAP